MNNNVNLDKFIDGIELIYCIKKRWKMILVIICALMIIVFAINKIASKELVYQSKSTIFIGKENTIGENTIYQNSDVLMYQSLVKSYEYIYMTKDLINSAIEGKIGKDVDTIKSNLKVTAMEETQILEIIYNDKNPNDAKNIVDLINDAFINKVNYLVPNSNVEVIEEPEIPTVAINSTNRIPYVVGILFSILIALGIALVVERWNDYILTEDELEMLVGKPILSVIPDIS